MPDSALLSLTSSAPANAGYTYLVQGGQDRKLFMTAAGVSLVEAANVAAQEALLTGLLAKAGGTMTGALSIATGTLTNSAPGLNLSQTWNDAADAFVASEISITNTASISSAVGDNYFQRFKVGGSVVGGFINFYDALAARVREVQLDYKGCGITAQNTTSWNMLCNSNYMASVRSTELRLASNVALTWKGDVAPYSGNADTKLPRVSAGILKITNGSDVLGGLQLGTASSSLQVGTHSAIGAETVTGFITIKDSAGNDRKIAVVS